MDLRMVKTRRQIKEAFLALREKFMPEHIKVKDICEVAMINKTTFYNHYADSASLSNEIDDSAVDKVVSDFHERGSILDDSRAYIKGLLGSLERERLFLSRVFRGRPDVFFSKLEERLCSLYRDKAKNAEEKTTLSFAIGGFIKLVKDYAMSESRYDVEKFIEYASQMIERLLVGRGKPLTEI